MESTPSPRGVLDKDVSRLDVDGTFSVTWTHRLRFTRNVLDPDNSLIDSLIPAQPRPIRVLSILDSGLVEAQPTLVDQLDRWLTHRAEQLVPAGPPLILPGGEQAKTGWNAFEQTAEAIAKGHVCRQSLVLIFGGGAVLDAAGFAAATSHRGVKVIRLPSTTLAQGDSGVGVKNAINAFGTKNFLGTFSPPHAVVNDTSLLASLDDRHWRGGLSEAVKVSLLKDPDLLQMIEQNTQPLLNRDLQTMEDVLIESARLHLDHIVNGGDPFENEEARPLDLGHWSAHRMEAISEWQLSHGDAVAIGLALDITYAMKIGMLPEAKAQRVIECLRALGFLESTPTLDDPDILLQGLEEFREHLGGQLAVPLVSDIGVATEVDEINMSAMRDSIRDLREAIS